MKRITTKEGKLDGRSALARKMKKVRATRKVGKFVNKRKYVRKPIGVNQVKFNLTADALKIISSRVNILRVSMWITWIVLAIHLILSFFN